jgi:hypothetical protein
MADARFAAPLRRLQSFRATKALPAFWPRPLKLKPLTAKMVSTLFFSAPLKYCSICLVTSWVRGSVAPAGSVHITMMLPWSSSGRKLVGSLRNSTAKAATMSA